MKILLQVLGENHPDVAICYSSIGCVHKDLLFGSEKALEYYQKALNIQLQVFGKDNHNVAISYKKIGINYYMIEDYEKAMNSFQLSLEMRCKISQTSILTSLGWVIFVATKLPSSQLISRQSSLKAIYSLCEQILGSDHEKVKELAQLIS